MPWFQTNKQNPDAKDRPTNKRIQREQGELTSGLQAVSLKHEWGFPDTSSSAAGHWSSAWPRGGGQGALPGSEGCLTMHTARPVSGASWQQKGFQGEADRIKKDSAKMEVWRLSTSVEAKCGLNTHLKSRYCCAPSFPYTLGSLRHCPLPSSLLSSGRAGRSFSRQLQLSSLRGMERVHCRGFQQT